MTEKSTATEKAALPEVGYYTDANGLTWQLSATDAAKAGFTTPDPAPAPVSPSVPAGPPKTG